MECKEKVRVLDGNGVEDMDAAGLECEFDLFYLRGWSQGVP